MTITAYRDQVACTVFPDMSVKLMAKGTGTYKVAEIQNKVSLTTLDVVFGDSKSEIQPGMKVLVRSDMYTQPWAKTVYELDGVKFILVPKIAVEMVMTAPAMGHFSSTVAPSDHFYANPSRW